MFQLRSGKAIIETQGITYVALLKPTIGTNEVLDVNKLNYNVN